jgi:DNA polymerase elongation subunit (family B)
MSESQNKVSNEVIESFLQGSDPQEFIVAIESDYSNNYVDLIINDRNIGEKRVEPCKYKPFVWFKQEIFETIYGGSTVKRIEEAGKAGVKIKKLRTWNDEGHSPERLENGYKYIAICDNSYNDLIRFFKNGGVDMFSQEFSKKFVAFSPTEQFMIQTGKRLFKGMEDYNDLHRLQFDLETEGLHASKNAIFQIGVKDNRGVEGVFETIGADGYERRKSERENIGKFFKIIDLVQPDIIAGYNSENFDWPFLFDRAERLSIPITELAITLNRAHKIKRKPSTLKLGGETESYNQTHMYGYNIIDISHAVRRAMAINSEIKSWGLKYITKYSEIAKPNRVYVPGDKINTTWADKKNDYAFNDTNGDWYKISAKNPLREGYVIKTGSYIVERYLCDDLWETEQIDEIFNQASFLISKILPTTYMRSSTMGTAGQWKLIMSAWSYQNELAIPDIQPKRDFTGGLSRLLEVGYAKNVVKLDFAALYPKTQLTHNIFPDLDITGVMEGILTYVVDTRDKYKFLTGKEKKKAKSIESKLKENADFDESEKAKLKKETTEHKALSNLYDKKQLPLKILANSWFGSYGAPYIFNWGDTDSAEETTCRGRQYLRLMVRHFTEKHGFRPLVGDTDGFNFSFPDNIDEIKYVAKGSHWKTTDDAGKELVGLDAVLAEFNENYMEGRMGLDIDDICNSTINFARKNYANDIGGKIKLVGNSIKSKKMSVYIEDFLSVAIRMLLDGDGYSFINYYYSYVDKIYNYQIPLIKMASKAKVKISIPEYKKKGTMKNKAGNPMPKQAHMELAMREGLDVTLGDVLYYINVGSAKSHGDLKTIEKNKMTKKEKQQYFDDNGSWPLIEKETQLNCKLINPETVEKDFEAIKELELLTKALDKLTDEETTTKQEIENRISEINSQLFTDEYNVARYLDAFNKKVKPLLVCFSPEIRNNILLDIVKIKDKETKKTFERLKERMIYTKNECELVSGKPFKETDQDSYGDLMIMEDKEIKFWDKVNKVPNNMEVEEWETIRADYHERMRMAKIEGIEHEKNKLDEAFRRMELNEFKNNKIPEEVYLFSYIDVDTKMFVSIKWSEDLFPFDDMFKYYKDSVERDKYYKLYGKEKDKDRYEQWLDYVMETKAMSGDTYFDEIIDTVDIDLNKIADKIKESSATIQIEQVEAKKKVKVSDENDDDDEDEDTSYDENDLKLDDEFDDTFSAAPDDYVPEETNNLETEEEIDDWGF